MLMPSRVLVALGATVALAAGAAPALGAARATDAACPPGQVPLAGFSDVAGGTPVDCLAMWGVTSGVTPTTYAPLAGVTRGQMAAFLTRTFDRAGGELPVDPPDAFSDDQGGTFERQADQLAALGITSGSGDGRYGPTEVVTRGQMATFLVRTAELLLGEPLPAGDDAFTDDTGSVHEARIDQAAAAGIAAGFSETRFGPQDRVNRQQMAAFITRTFDRVVSGREGLVSAYGTEGVAFTATRDGVVRTFSGGGVASLPPGTWTLTRADGEPGQSVEIALGGLVAVPGTAAAPPDRCPAPVPAGEGLDPFYDLYCDVAGIPLVADGVVDPQAMRIAAGYARQMLAVRPDVAAALAASTVRIGLIGRDQQTTDMPEWSDLDEAFPGTDWDARTRGVGATEARPLVGAGEENVLCLPEDRYLGESIFVHELSHTILQLGVETLDRTFRSRLVDAYDNAVATGLWDGTYAQTNPDEYWAEAVQSWFDTNQASDFQHNEIDTRAELKGYDPQVAGLVQEVFGDTPWRPTCP